MYQYDELLKLEFYPENIAKDHSATLFGEIDLELQRKIPNRKYTVIVPDSLSDRVTDRQTDRQRVRQGVYYRQREIDVKNIYLYQVIMFF